MADITLTPEQKAVINDRGGTLLVSAAAGSGKTKVLVERLLSLMTDGREQHNVDEFLLSTFSRAAARELRSKIRKGIQERLEKEPQNRFLQKQLVRLHFTQISTVHALCAMLLREYAGMTGVAPDFRIGDELECKLLREKAIDTAVANCYEKMSDNFRMFTDTIGNGRDDRKVSSIVLSLYEKAESHRDPEAWLQKSVSEFSFSENMDYGETLWGRLLLQNVREQLSAYAVGLQGVLKEISVDEALNQAYVPGFQADAETLERYSRFQSWDEFYKAGKPQFVRLKQAKNADADLKEFASGYRDRIKEQVGRLFIPFELSSEDAVNETGQCRNVLLGILEVYRVFSSNYTSEKERIHVLDYGDLEHETLKLLYQGKTDIVSSCARDIRKRYYAVMVDEYQDTNEVQDAIFRALSQDGKNLFMVGDIKQSIYRFRLADPKIFLRKYNSYPDYDRSENGEPRRILLSQNFRSRTEILDAANAVFSEMMTERTGGLHYGKKEALAAGLQWKPLPFPAVELHCISTEDTAEKSAEAEARIVAQRIRELLDGTECIQEGDEFRKANASDIAILLRAMTNSAYYMKALADYGIPSSCETGENIMLSEEIQIISSLMETVHNPHRDIPLAAAICSPLFDISADELADAASVPHVDLWEAVRCSDNPKLESFTRLIHRLRDIVNTDGLSAMLNSMLRITDAEAVFQLMQDGNKRIDNLRYFQNAVNTHEQSGGTLSTIVGQFEHMREKGIEHTAANAGNAVTLMSVHKSKGLEFPIVVLPGLSKQFNMDDLREPVLTHAEYGLACNYVDLDNRIYYPSVSKLALSSSLRQESVSEEMRILYVAMTRPRDMLIMFYTSSKLESKLSELAFKMKYLPRDYCSASVSCMGDWVLSTALLRTEAGCLTSRFAISPDASVSSYPWKIIMHQAENMEYDNVNAERETVTQQENTYILPKEFAACSYLYSESVLVPARITATQLKGRTLDNELPQNNEMFCASERSSESEGHFRNQASKLSRGGVHLSAAERGTAIHIFLQYADLKKCTDLPSAKAELERLVLEEYISQEQRSAVDPMDAVRLADSAAGREIFTADKVVREFKFSLLCDSAEYLGTKVHENIMLQGIADCCILKNGKMTVIDFKSDHVLPGQEVVAAQKYRTQLETYSRALSVIFETEVSRRVIYFVRTGCSVEL